MSQLDVTNTDYMGGFQYVAGKLSFFPHAEGYVTATPKKSAVGAPTSYSFNYVYQYKDHLGNNRLSYTNNILSPGSIVVLEENHYYPFGLIHTNYNTTKYEFVKVESGNDYYINIEQLPAGGVSNYKYKYNGKEYQDELGLNMYDYGARNYDPALGRWMNIDPLAEKYYPVSPYTISLNNPIFFVDPNGEEIWIYSDYGDEKNGKREKYEYQKDRDYSKYSGFRADAYKALDALYEASNITVDGEEVNIMQELMSDKRELSLVKGSETRFKYGRKYDDINDTGTDSFNNIGTVFFNNKDGVIFDDITNPKKASDGGNPNYFADQIKNGKLNKTTQINSPTSVLGHDMGHAFGFMRSASDYHSRKDNKNYVQNGVTFPNQEEARATSLSTQININLSENPRTNYIGSPVATKNVLSNQMK